MRTVKRVAEYHVSQIRSLDPFAEGCLSHGTSVQWSTTEGRRLYEEDSPRGAWQPQPGEQAALDVGVMSLGLHVGCRDH